MSLRRGCVPAAAAWKLSAWYWAVPGANTVLGIGKKLKSPTVDAVRRNLVARERRAGGWILDRDQGAALQNALREIAGALQRRRKSIVRNAVAVHRSGTGIELVAVEEEQLIVASRFPDGPADRKAKVFVPAGSLDLAVEQGALVRGVPVRPAHSVVDPLP